MARVRVGPHRSGAQCQIYGELDTQGGFIWSSQHRLREYVQDRCAGEIEHPVAGAFSQGTTVWFLHHPPNHPN